MKKALITLCTVATTLVAGSAFAAGATGERGYRHGLYDNSPVLNTWETNQTAMTPYNKDNSSDSVISSPAGTTSQDLNSTDAPNMDSTTPSDQSRSQSTQ